MEQQLDLGEGVLRLEDGPLLHLVWNPGVRIDAGNARAAMDAVNKLASGRTYPLLVDMAASMFLSRSAREVFAEPCAVSRIALLGESPVDRALVDYQLQTSKAPCPTRFFTSRVKALTWLGDAAQTFPPLTDR
ncbi:STAS/SEC14 domain-containing protein [Arthrobacter sp. ISL-95]|uniref:DUF7793 family protein n=1 Tax=Arthrobacter sp. ISL-95 TaxID=2819116 RepID=UPI001BE79732|nr:STAS/SEC14 domain-containing protein [Arthrobacter sp. ISL-95]MBT2588413.1 STAS/SEC14 domain-containing protein [Arthrobacter sp. ISL-95]